MTKQADYGIVLMTHMANHPELRYTAPELSSLTLIPQPMVSKILKILGKGGLLVSHRGVKGGYSLAREPRKINVAEMITTLDGPIAFTECIEGSPGSCSQEAVCSLRGNWQRINLALKEALSGISLEELTHPLPPLVPLSHSREPRGEMEDHEALKDNPDQLRRSKSSAAGSFGQMGISA